MSPDARHAPNAICRSCPIASCDWHHDEPALPEMRTWHPISEDLVRAGGDVVLAIVGASLRAETKRVEAIVREHFEGHGLLDWVREVVRLNAEIERRAPAADVSLGLR